MQELVEQERKAAAHKVCRPLSSSFEDLLPGDQFQSSPLSIPVAD